MNTLPFTKDYLVFHPSRPGFMIGRIQNGLLHRVDQNGQKLQDRFFALENLILQLARGLGSPDADLTLVEDVPGPKNKHRTTLRKALGLKSSKKTAAAPKKRNGNLRNIAPEHRYQGKYSDAEKAQVKLLADQGLSLREIAEQTGISKSTVSRLLAA